MPRNGAGSAKAERDQLRDRMRDLGCSVAQIAAEMSRRFNLRPRIAWRHAMGWPQWKLAVAYNTAHPGAKLSDGRVSAYESWPHGGEPPSIHYLVNLATTFGHGCTPAQLVDADDLEHLSATTRRLLTSSSLGEPVNHAVALLPGDKAWPELGRPRQGADNVPTGVAVASCAVMPAVCLSARR